MMLSPHQLVINEDYQRELSLQSIRQIKRMAANWDWKNYKALSVARTDDPNIFEVIDGQHSAIAAMTNGKILLLPSLKAAADTLKEKACGFLGINTQRIALTRAAVYVAEVAAQDDLAISVECALSEAGARILATPPPTGKYNIGDTLAISSLKTIAKSHSQSRLIRILKIAVEGEAAPISAALIKALDIALPHRVASDVDKRISAKLRVQGTGRLEIIAKGKTPKGARVYETLADMISNMTDLPEKRMGRKKAS